MIDFLEELRWRGLLYQCTDETGLRAHLASGGRRCYGGFDPTADSLTIGNLVPIMVLTHWQRAGHTPVVVMGGGTGLIGDPSGKTSERTLRSEDEVNANVRAQRPIFERLLRFDGPNAARIENNADWLKKLGFVEVLRDIGKHLSVNEMIKRDSIRSRLEDRDHGISYTEFSYMLLQAYDFLHLFREMGVSVQVGGSDQWGNIVPGADLIRRLGQSGADVAPAFGITAPLFTKADGTKFGKTEGGAVWLSAPRTSDYALYQFWLNAADADVGRMLRFFTLLSKDEIEQVEAEHARDPGQRAAQRTLARAATTLVRGERATHQAERAAQALFSGDVADLDRATLDEVFASVPSTEHRRDELAASPAGIALVDLLPLTSLCKSKREAREHLAAGAISVNGRPVAGEDARLTSDMLLFGEIAAIRRGKKAWHVTRWR